MKFEQKYPEAKTFDRFEFEYSYVTKEPKLGQCFDCGCFTRWIDIRLEKHICSERCGGAVWKSWENATSKQTKYEKFDAFKKKAEAELEAACYCKKGSKDIIVVVRDQLEYVRDCIESIRLYTKNYKLWVWDNGSGEETKRYIESLQKEFQSLRQEREDLDWELEVWTSQSNIGFIEPNNILAEAGEGDYIIPLNSDTKVYEHWDTAMLAHLQNYENVAQVGYWGGHLGPDGRGFGGDNGYEIDYIPGWCFCINRKMVFEKYGLFNKQLKFAYCEDADLSLRLKEAGHKIYALHIPLVYHHQNKTINQVEKEGQIDIRATFDHNHKYIQRRWKNYLENDRVLLHRKDSDELAEVS